MIIGKVDFFEKYDALAEKHQDGDCDNITLIVKNHMLFEELFRDYCIVNGGNPRKKTFYQVLSMARNFCPENKQCDWVWETIGKLNKLRNIVAHELEPSEHKYAGLNDAIVIGSRGLLAGPNTLKSSLAHLFGFTLGMLSV